MRKASRDHSKTWLTSIASPSLQRAAYNDDPTAKLRKSMSATSIQPSAKTNSTSLIGSPTSTGGSM